MGTISDKLTYLNDTKTKIRDGINAIGGSLDSDDTFRSYADELDNLYNEMPKVSASNVQQATLNNTKQAKMTIDLKGNTQQDSTTGKNKCGLTDGTYSNNGVTVVVSKGKVTINGKATATSFVNIPFIQNVTFSSQTYSFSLNNNSTKNDSTMRLYTTGTYYESVSLSTQNNSGTYTTDREFGSLQLRTTQNVEYSNFVLYPQLEVGQPTSYEEYTGNQPSPSPTYPQDINVVSGDNTIEICGKNLYNKDNITNGNYLTSTGEIGSSVNWSISDYIKVQANEKYAHQGITITGINTYSCYYDSDKNFVSSFKIATGNRTITIPDGISYVRFSINISDSHQDMNTFMLEKGSTASTYKAYTGQSQLISLGVENLFDKSDIETGKYYKTSVIDTSLNWAISQVKVQPNTNYYLSGNNYNNNTAKIVLLDSSKNILSSVGGYYETHLITTSSTTAYIGLSISLNADGNDLNTIQIEKGSKANSYTPYGTTPIELCKIGTYQDYIYKEDDKWYLHKEIGKVILDGSEDWYAPSDLNNGNYQTHINITNKKGNTSGYCNRFIAINSWAESECFITKSATGLFFNILGTRLSALTDTGVKHFFEDNNTIAYYVLSTPTNTEITDNLLINQLNTILYSYNGQTNVSQSNNDEAFILDVSALLDANTYIDHLEAQVEALS